MSGLVRPIWAAQINKAALPMFIELGDEKIADLDFSLPLKWIFVSFDDDTFEVIPYTEFNRRFRTLFQTQTLKYFARKEIRAKQ